MFSYKYLEISFRNVNATNAVTSRGDPFSPLKPPAVDLVLTIPAAVNPLLQLPTALAGRHYIPDQSQWEVLTDQMGRPAVFFFSPLGR